MHITKETLWIGYWILGKKILLEDWNPRTLKILHNAIANLSTRLQKFCCQYQRANKFINGAFFNLSKAIPSMYRYFFCLPKVFQSRLAIVISQKRHRQISPKLCSWCYLSIYLQLICLLSSACLLLCHNLWAFRKCSTLNEILVFSIKLVSKVS